MKTVISCKGAPVMVTVKVRSDLEFRLWLMTLAPFWPTH